MMGTHLVSAYRATLLLALAAFAAGCKSKSSDASQSGSPSATGNPENKPSRRATLDAHRPLLDEVGRAELDVGGVIIDFGAPDQHKYTRGGWRSGWGETKTEGDVTSVALTSRRGFLDIPAARVAPTAIVVRARAGGGDQQLTWLIDGRELGTVKLTKEWSVVRAPLAKDAFPTEGIVRLEARASAGGDGGVRAELDWVWLARGEGEPAIYPRVLPIEVGGISRRTLAAPTARTYAFYLQPPPQAHLVVDLGASESADFVVSAVTDDGERVELLHETVERGWEERAVSLAALADRAVRLELTTKNQRGAAGWGEPEIRIERTAETPAVAGAAANAGDADATTTTVAAGNAGTAAKPVVPGTPPRNVILLVMDTARADAFGPFAGPNRIVETPTFDALAAKSTVFARAYNNENWTKPSVATTLSGLYPSTHGAKQDASKLSSDVELLSERLQREGFATAGFVANGYVSNVFGFEQGWDTFRNYIRENRSSEAEYVFGDALAWHAEHTKKHPDKPFFLYLQTIDPHVTYRVDKQYWSPYFEGDYDGPLGKAIEATDQVKLSTKKIVATERDKKWLRALYFGEIAYHDAELAKFLAELEKRGVLDNTMLIVTNDHGEELGERGRYGHGHQVFEEMIRAPLIVHYPPLFPPGGVIEEIVEHVDLAPTILDVLGKAPLEAADGVSMLPLVKRQPTQLPHYAMTEFLEGRRVLRVGHWKLFGHPGGGGSLFDIAKDPEEKLDLGDLAPVARRLCEIHLAEALAIPVKAKRMQGIASRRQFRAGEANISPQMRRQLEALGYFGGTPKSEPADGDEDKDDKQKK